MLTTYLIVPALSDQAGQLRIVSREHDNKFRVELSDYRRNPELWKEAGLVNTDGKLKCIEAPSTLASTCRARSHCCLPTPTRLIRKENPHDAGMH